MTESHKINVNFQATIQLLHHLCNLPIFAFLEFLLPPGLSYKN